MAVLLCLRIESEMWGDSAKLILVRLASNLEKCLRALTSRYTDLVDRCPHFAGTEERIRSQHQFQQLSRRDAKAYPSSEEWGAHAPSRVPSGASPVETLLKASQ